ncbi:hypothetical protein cypCar_00014154 [Cyprinus carpio]|nr:hypothetical protein cypCar_00014154 [Cyprinus carpio]
MDDIEDCVFVDSDTVVTQCVPDSYEPSSCQYHQKPDVPRHPEVVVELEDFEDPVYFNKSEYEMQRSSEGHRKILPTASNISCDKTRRHYYPETLTLE